MRSLFTLLFLGSSCLWAQSTASDSTGIISSSAAQDSNFHTLSSNSSSVAISSSSLATKLPNSLAESRPETEHHFPLSAIPAIAKTPATSWEFGGLVIYRLSDTTPSRVEASALYSVRNQLRLDIYPDLYLNDWHIQPYLDYRVWPTNYYGPISDFHGKPLIGTFTNHSLEADVSADLNLHNGWSVGVGWFLKNNDINWPDSVLNAIPTLKSDLLFASGGMTSGPRLGIQYDSRDHKLMPHRGYYLVYQGLWMMPETFSSSQGYIYDTLGNNGIRSIDYNLQSLYATAYYPITEHSTMVLNIGGQEAFGTVPFFALPTTDGITILRGIDPGMVSGNKVLSAQAEYRFPLFPWKIDGILGRILNYTEAAIFEDNAWAGAADGDIQTGWMSSAGLGLRWIMDPIQKTCIRIDLAESVKGFNMVLYVREPF